MIINKQTYLKKKKTKIIDKQIYNTYITYLGLDINLKLISIKKVNKIY